MSKLYSSNILQWLSEAIEPALEVQQRPVTPEKPLKEPSTPTVAGSLVFSPGQASAETPATQWSFSEDTARESRNRTFEAKRSNSGDINQSARPYELHTFVDIARIRQLRTREVRPVPCLQCVLLDLPCDPAYAGCSRCKRRGEQYLCLAQQPILQEELEFENHSLLRPRYKLLRLNEDDEVWERKKHLEVMVLDKLQHRLDRQNWVLPDSQGARSGFSRSILAWKRVNALDIRRGIPYSPGDKAG